MNENKTNINCVVWIYGNIYTNTYKIKDFIK